MKKRIYKLGRPLGLTYKEIADILSQTISRREQTSLKPGPYIYEGGWYGTVNIYNF